MTIAIAIPVCIRLFNINEWGTSFIPVAVLPDVGPNSTAALIIEANPLKIQLFLFQKYISSFYT